MNIIDKFVNRLNHIGIEVTLTANYPWVYLETVNNKKETIFGAEICKM